MSEIKLSKLKDRAGTGAVNFTHGFKIAGTDSGLIGITHTESSTEPSSPSNGDTWWDPDNSRYQVYINSEWKTFIGAAPVSGIDWGGDRGVFAGGYTTAYVDTIDYVDITSAGNATDFGDLTTTARYICEGGASNQTRGLRFGGTGGSPVNHLDVIDYVTISSTGNATDFGNLTAARQFGTAFGDATYGVCAGGNDISAGYPKFNVIDYVTIATTGNAADFGDLSAVSNGCVSVNDATRGVIALSTNASNVNTLEYVTIASTGNTTDFGDLGVIHSAGAGGFDATRGVFAGGWTGSARTNAIDYITIQTTGNSSDFGDLTVARNTGPGAGSNGTSSVFAGGNTGSATNVMDSITIQTTGDATDFGDLTSARFGLCGFSGNAAQGGNMSEANIVKKPITFSLPIEASENINQVAAARVAEKLPEIDQATRAFDRNNSQTTLAMMTLTMLNGHSPMRILRQITAEVEKRKMALSEAQVGHAEARQEILELEELDDAVSEAKLKHKRHSLMMMENKINGSIKDIATLIDSYENIKEHHDIDEWDEEAFEKEEKRHHVRRGFELMYRNLMDGGRASTATIEYMQQYGVHPQLALTEVSGYIKHTAERIQKKQLLHANDLEDFLDQMADKYQSNPDETAKRIFGKADFVNPEYMLRLEKPEAETEDDT